MHKWCGIAGTIGPNEKCADCSPSDYERACDVKGYADIIDVQNGSSAIVLWGMPLSTTVFKNSCGNVIIVRAFYMDPEIDIEESVNNIPDSEFYDPIESLCFEVVDGKFAIFDSAYPGRSVKDQTLYFELPAAAHRIITKDIKVEPKTSLLLHKIVPVLQS